MLALEIAVDSLAAAVVGLGGAVLELIRDRSTERPHLGRRHRRPTSPSWPSRLRARRPPDEPLVGVGVAVVGVVRRSDGFVSMAPNLGWRDVPLGRAAGAARWTLPVPIAVANDADLGALVEHRRGAAIGADNVLFISGEYGVGGGVIVDGLPLTGVAGYGGEVGHMPVNPNGTRLPLRLDRLLGDRGRRGGAPAPGGPPDRRRAGRGRRGAARGRGRLARRLERPRSRRPLAGDRAGRPRQHLRSGADRARRDVRADPPVHRRLARGELDRRALAGPRRLVRVVPAILGADAPLLGAGELAFEPLLADPAAWLPTRGTLAVLASA